ncbi:hypothetical protein BsWGS_04977 [Bradybaena similaris]
MCSQGWDQGLQETKHLQCAVKVGTRGCKRPNTFSVQRNWMVMIMIISTLISGAPNPHFSRDTFSTFQWESGLIPVPTLGKIILHDLICDSMQLPPVLEIQSDLKTQPDLETGADSLRGTAGSTTGG